MSETKQAIERVDRGRFAKGQSGNPGGRAAVPAHIKEMLGELTPRAVEIMAETMGCDDPKLRFLAAQEILNRTLGKPKQDVALNVRTDAASAHFAALQSLTALAAAHSGPVLEHQPIVDVEPDVER
ncbi:hypothetical protein [Mesorhizobium sp.]|uniref:hypothetical protein n=1 Tax=Mesorhizobium sp. TaxID=1871066 RepID=UPI000FE6A2CF|nr:hypothetical protein [Mesorhizobium sp.]RWG07542.1 MAG: hypothetical protein EOQ54_04040 [Mesorhizobium sp.]